MLVCDTSLVRRQPVNHDKRPGTPPTASHSEQQTAAHTGTRIADRPPPTCRCTTPPATPPPHRTCAARSGAETPAKEHGRNPGSIRQPEPHLTPVGAVSGGGDVYPDQPIAYPTEPTAVRLRTTNAPPTTNRCQHPRPLNMPKCTSPREPQHATGSKMDNPWINRAETLWQHPVTQQWAAHALATADEQHQDDIRATADWHLPVRTPAGSTPFWPASVR